MKFTQCISMRMIRNYINYFENVLGLHQITNTHENKDVLFVQEDRDQWDTAQKNLFEKMAAAMKLLPSQYALVSLGNVERYSGKAIIHFTIQVPAEPDHPHYYVYSPSVLLQHPERKSGAWLTLQKVMSIL